MLNESRNVGELQEGDKREVSGIREQLGHRVLGATRLDAEAVLHALEHQGIVSLAQLPRTRKQRPDILVYETLGFSRLDNAKDLDWRLLVKACPLERLLHDGVPWLGEVAEAIRLRVVEKLVEEALVNRKVAH